MAPNSRPPLTSRIRASFDGKRSKSDATSPITANGFTTQDPESLQKAIDDAINSETFQKAIAANLAKLIKPSIKSALDTIQPVVEAVYSHELLLRKTNQSVEDILLRLDSHGVTASQQESLASRRESLVEPLGPEPSDGVPTGEVGDRGGKTPTQETPRELGTSNPGPAQHKQLPEDNHAKTTSALVELSSHVEASNSKLSEALQGIHDVDTKLRWTSDNIETLKSDSEQSHTTMAVLQAQLDQLKEDIGQLMTAVGTDLGKNVQALSAQGAGQDTSLLDAHTTKLDAISTDLAALKGIEKIDAVSTELASIKASVEAGIASNNEGFSGLGSQIGTVLSTLEGHAGKLDDINSKPPHPEILAALQQSNDSHAAHAVSLSEIKDRSISGPAPATVENGADPTAALQELKSDLASLKENIEAGLTSNNETVTKIHDAVSIIPGADILAAVQQSNESHASHAAALDELKAHGSTHSASLDELKSRETSTPAAATLDTSELTAKIDDLHETINGHTAALDEIKANSGLHATSLDELKTREISAPSGGVLDTSELTTKIDTISEAVNAHTAALDEIKATGGAQLTALESHGNALEGLKSINNVPESVAETEVSNLAPLEAHMGSIVSILEEHSEALNEIKSATGAHTSALEIHGTALEGIKSKDVSAPVADNSGLEAQIAELVTKLETALEEIKATGASHTTALESHGSTLEGLKSVGASDVDLSGLEGHIASIIATLETHTAALEQLKSSSTGLEQSRSISDAPIVDNSGLENQINTIISTLQLHTSTLDDLKSPTLPPMTPGIDSTSLSALEIQIGSMISTLNHQTDAIKSLQLVSSHDPESTTKEPTVPPSDTLGEVMSTIVETLEMHTTLLNEMKEDVSAEILTTLHDLASDQGNMSNLLTEIREADLSDEVLTLLHEHKSVLDEIKAKDVGEAGGNVVDLTSLETKLDGIAANIEGHQTSFAELKELHASHGGVLDEIKSKSVETEPSSTSAVDISTLETQFNSIHTALEGHQASFSELKELHASHGGVLDEIKSKSVEVQPTSTVDISSLETQLASINTALEGHQASFSELKELHASHGASLDEIKSAPVPVTDFSGLETQLGAISSAFEEHKATLSEVKDLHVSHGTSLDELKSRSVEAQPTSPVDLSSVEAQLAAITTALAEAKELHVSHGSSLDKIKSRSIDAQPTSAVDLSGLESQLGAITTALEEHKASLFEMKELHTAHGALLDEFKTHSLEASSAAAIDLSDIEAQLAGISSALEQHQATLAEVKSTSLASHELHTLHATSLNDIKARLVEPAVAAPAIDISSLEAQMKTINSSIDEIKAKSLEPAASAVPVDLSGLETQLAGLATILEEHKVTLSEVKATSLASQDMHAAHVSSLDEIKSRSVETSSIDLSSLEAQLSAINASLDDHTNMLSNISEATLLSNNTHAAHTAMLSDIKDASQSSIESHSAHASALLDIKDATSSWNEAHSANAFTLAEIKDAALASKESHMSHAAVLNELKDGIYRGNEAHAAHTSAFAELKAIPSSEGSTVDLSPIEGHLTTIISTLEGQTTNLAEIKEASSHEDILTNISELKSIISDSHNEVKDSHSHLTETLGALALGGAAGAGATALLTSDDTNSSKEILGEVKTFNESLTTLTSQIAINHTTTTTCINTLSDELKAEIDATGTALSSSLLSSFPSLSPLTSSIQTVEQKLDGLEGSVKQTGSFVVGLYEGVHLNDTGVGQLQEQLVNWVVKGGFATPKDPFSGRGAETEAQRGLEVPIEEGAWFQRKRANSNSPLREVSTVSPPVEREVEEGEKEGEEEMPSIDSVISGKEVLGGALALGAVGAVAAGVAVHEHEHEEDGSREVVPEVEKEPEEGTTIEREPLPTADESKDIEQPEPAVDATPEPESLEESLAVEQHMSEEKSEPEIVHESPAVDPEPLVEEPEAHIDEAPIPESMPADSEDMAQKEINQEPETVEGLAPLESETIPTEPQADVSGEIHEEEIIPETLDENTPGESEPVLEVDKDDIEPPSPADTEDGFDLKNMSEEIPVHSEPIVDGTPMPETQDEEESKSAEEETEIQVDSQPEEHVEEAVIPENLEESVPVESEEPAQSHELDGQDAPLPETQEAEPLNAEPETDIAEEKGEELHEPIEEEPIVPTHVQDEVAPEISVPVENEEIEESLPIHEDEASDEVPIESESAPEEKELEEPVETEAVVEGALVPHHEEDPEVSEPVPDAIEEPITEDAKPGQPEEPIEENTDTEVPIETQPVDDNLIPHSEEHEVLVAPESTEPINENIEDMSAEDGAHEKPVEEELVEPTPVVEHALILESEEDAAKTSDPIHEPVEEDTAPVPSEESVSNTVENHVGSPEEIETADPEPETDESKGLEDEMNVSNIEDQPDHDDENSRDKEATEPEQEVPDEIESANPEIEHAGDTVEPQHEDLESGIKDDVPEHEDPAHDDEPIHETNADAPSISRDEHGTVSGHQSETEEDTQHSSEELPLEKIEAHILPINEDEDKPIDSDLSHDHEPQHDVSSPSHEVDDGNVDEGAEEGHHVEPKSNAVDHTSSETTELDDETPREPEPTPAEPVDNEAAMHEEQLGELHVPSVQPTPDESEAGGALIEDSQIVTEPPSSPFIESPLSHPLPPHHSIEADSNPVEFSEPHPSPLSEHNPGPLLPEEDSEDEGIPLTVQSPLESPMEFHSIPHSGLHADATPMSEDDENPFEDPDNVLSPSDALTPAGVLSPGEEIEEPIFQDLDGLEGRDEEQGMEEESGREDVMDEDEDEEPSNLLHGEEEEEEDEEIEFPTATSHPLTHGTLLDDTEAENHPTHDISHEHEEEDGSSILSTHEHEEEHERSPHVDEEDDDEHIHEAALPPSSHNDEPEESPSTPPPHPTHHIDDSDKKESPISHHTPTPAQAHTQDSDEEEEEDQQNSSPALSGGFA